MSRIDTGLWMVREINLPISLRPYGAIVVSLWMLRMVSEAKVLDVEKELTNYFGCKECPANRECKRVLITADNETKQAVQFQAFLPTQSRFLEFDYTGQLGCRTLGGYEEFQLNDMRLICGIQKRAG